MPMIATKGVSYSNQLIACRALITNFFRLSTIVVAFASAATAQGSMASTSAGTQGGASAIWIFANLSFTGMRAQAQGNTFWKVIAFIFGFPGTLLTLLVVTAGGERAYESICLETDKAK